MARTRDPIRRAQLLVTGGVAACARRFSADGVLLTATSVRGMKYGTPAALGDELIITVEPTAELPDATDADAYRASASIARAFDGQELISIAEIDLAFQPRSARDPREVGPSAAAEGAVRIRADECDARGCLSLHAALRHFERQRTRAIGGPAGLAALQAS